VKTIPLGRILAAFIVYVGLMAAASASTSDVITLGDNTYSVTRQASSAFKRDVDALKAEAQDAAAKFCAAQGKQLKVVSVTADKPLFGFGYAKAKIVFKALNAGEVDLAPAASTANEPVEHRAPSTGELYNDLMKLDDLRKKGILTEEEFQSEKRKVLSHSN
jgi:Short C-terminal domain